MRVWTFAEPSPAGGAWRIYADGREIATISDWPGTEDAQFIVSACNAAEQRADEERPTAALLRALARTRETLGVYSEAEKRLRDLGR